jgi:putative Mg2+ transporter-C (MgtC) family protein
MQTALTLETFLSLLLAVAFGAIVGIEREFTHKPAGLRTHMLVSLGSCLFTVVSVARANNRATD